MSTTPAASLSEQVANLARHFARTVDSDVLSKCGQAIVDQLHNAFLSLYVGGDGEGSSLDNNPTFTFRALRAVARRKIQSLPFDSVGGEWLRLYVDATAGIVLSQMLSGEISRRCIGESIKALDMAIIIAGAIGREDAIQSMIKVLQQVQRPLRNDANPATSLGSSRVTEARPIKRQRLTGYASSGSRQPIPALKIPPTISQFNDCGRNRPFILRNHVAKADDRLNPYGLSWPAIEKWQSMEYLVKLVGEDRVVPVEVGTSYTDAAWTQRIVPFREFLESVGYALPGLRTTANAAQSESPMYLAQYSLLKQFPQLQRDIIMPDYVFAAPTAPDSFPGYQPPGNEEELVVNVWVGAGQKSVTSPPHTDPYYNCYAQVLGHKRVWLAPPSMTPYMYAHGSDPGANEDIVSHAYTTNTSTVRVFDLTPDDRERWPEFYRHVEAECMESVLEPGDLLFMPPGWWHAMRGEGSGVAWSVSMWF